MVGVRADYIMSSIDRQAGSLVKRVQNGSNDFLPPEVKSGSSSNPEGQNVSLSQAALDIATILKRGNANSTRSAASFDDFIKGMHNQLLAKGKDAEALKELPDSHDPGRVNLAKQAANYLLTIQYNSEELYTGVSSENPFSGIDRKSLSSISFDDSGAFTSAERQAAFLELSTRDVEFRNKVYDTQPQISQNDGFQSQITSLLADATLVSAMSEAERSWRGWPSAEELTAQADILMESSGKKGATLPSYQNLDASENSVLAAVTDSEGKSSWKQIAAKDLGTSSVAISLIDSLWQKTAQGSSQHELESSQGSTWVSLYTQIEGFRS